MENKELNRLSKQVVKLYELKGNAAEILKSYMRSAYYAGKSDGIKEMSNELVWEK